MAGEVRCTECDTPARGPATSWRAYLTGGFDGEPVEVVVYCPACSGPVVLIGSIRPER